MKNTTKTTKSFLVASISENTNSFGLRGHVLVSRDGTAFQVGRSDSIGHGRWTKGQIVEVPFLKLSDGREDLNWGSQCCEVPLALPPCPAGALDELFYREPAKSCHACRQPKQPKQALAVVNLQDVRRIHRALVQSSKDKYGKVVSEHSMLGFCSLLPTTGDNILLQFHSLADSLCSKP